MNNAWSKAIEVYKQVFGKEPDLADFDNRLLFQKTAYLAKLFGVNFDSISFTWYDRGPYSFDIAGIYPKSTHLPHELKDGEIQKIRSNKKKLLEFLSNPKDAELYASVAYLLFEEKLNEKETVHRMNLIKPWFKQKEVEGAIKKVKGYFEIS